MTKALAGIAMLACVATACGGTGASETSAAPDSQTRGRSGTTTTQAGVPTTAEPSIPTFVDAQGDVSTECVTIPTDGLGYPTGYSTPICATINADGSITTVAEVGDGSRAITCVDATVDDASLTPGQYLIVCGVFGEGAGAHEDAFAFPDHPVLCAVVNDGTLRAGVTAASELAMASAVCLNRDTNSVSLYQRAEAVVPCQASGEAIDCRT